MNESVSDCDRWHEPISLLAAGCLPADEEAGVRRHSADCAACSARLADLTALCARLARSAAPAAARVAAVCDRWQAAGPFATRSRVRVPAQTLLWAGGALAAALLVSVAWLAGHAWDEPQSLHPAQDGAGAGSPPVVKTPRRRSGDAETSVSGPRGGDAEAQPTLLAYALALAKSEEAFEALLRRQGASTAFDVRDARTLLKECL